VPIRVVGKRRSASATGSLERFISYRCRFRLVASAYLRTAGLSADSFYPSDLNMTTQLPALRPAEEETEAVSSAGER
jgi:hypothetical protein